MERFKVMVELPLLSRGAADLTYTVFMKSTVLWSIAQCYRSRIGYPDSSGRLRIVSHSPEKSCEGTKAEASETQEAILVAADRFLERGVAQSTLMLIACHAGVTRGALFHFRKVILRTIIGNVGFPQREIMLRPSTTQSMRSSQSFQALRLSRTTGVSETFHHYQPACEFVGEMAA